jgi:hypothetical protein
MLPLRRFGRCHNKITCDSEKSSRVRQTLDHERRERVVNIQRDIAPLFDGGSNIHTVCLQSMTLTSKIFFVCKDFSGRLGSDCG